MSTPPRRSALARLVAGAAVMTGMLVAAVAAHAQPIDMSRGGPVDITASTGIDWHQTEQEVIAIGNARATRGNVTVIADRLIAHYRKKASAAAPGQATGTTQPHATPVAATPGLPSDTDTGGSEIYQLEAVGNVHIYTPTDQATADHAVYDIDRAVLVMTGHDLRVTTPQDVITARDSMEYWSQKHMAVARGDAVIVTNDARRLSADTIVAYTTPPEQKDQPAGTAQGTAQGTTTAPAPAATPEDPLAASGKLQRVEVFGNVEIRTATQIVRGDRGVYVPDTGIARLAGNTRLTQGDNQVNGDGLEVNLRTGVYRLIADPGARVQGLVIPNDTGGAGTASPNGAKPTAAKPGAAAPAKAQP